MSDGNEALRGERLRPGFHSPRDSANPRSQGET
jgi:hypothetical protein